MLLQFLNDDRTIFIAFHFFVAGILAGIFLMRPRIKKMKETMLELERELQKSYEDNIIQLHK